MNVHFCGNGILFFNIFIKLLKCFKKMATTTDKIVKHQTCKLTLQHQVFIDILTFLSKKLLTEIKPYESCEKVPENIEKVPGDFTSDNRPFIADLQ